MSANDPIRPMGGPAAPVPPTDPVLASPPADSVRTTGTGPGASGGDDPEAIRREIERTRAALSDDVNALTDTANPKNIAKRQGEKVKDAASGLRDRVMGTAGDAGSAVGEAVSSVGDRVGSVGDRVASVPGRATDGTRGNPLAAGLIAFGVGLLVAGLIPPSRREQRAVSDLAERAAPLAEAAQDSVRELGESLKEPAQEAVAAVKETATEGVDHVRSEGGSAAEQVKDQTKRSAESVQESRHS